MTTKYQQWKRQKTECNPHPIINDDGAVVAYVFGAMEGHLVEAAPDLLRACEMMLAYGDSEIVSNKELAIESALGAVKKAGYGIGVTRKFPVAVEIRSPL